MAGRAGPRCGARTKHFGGRLCQAKELLGTGRFKAAGALAAETVFLKTTAKYKNRIALHIACACARVMESWADVI